ncbi:BigG family transcription antiterminator [Coriobacterium glomerans PW2]|uniref:BigG family transcription antiterminator n=1 Tax=Coriobacterium glomerans (strain ATCC 49209 / DSM 20642 / JCM 10262 / PW2) TaxID=700015 RepID=F2N6Z4_CORGP|nr:hypothetical protein [Coriobacterium glomerans]AEB06193.1 BigG family transcription antiterminator [Coriobacterium glomerans PW2]
MHLVVVLSFNKYDQAIFYSVFDPLVAGLSNSSHVDALVRLDSYQSFIDDLCELIDQMHRSTRA